MPIVTDRRSFLMAGRALLAGACLPAATFAAGPVRKISPEVRMAGAGRSHQVGSRRRTDSEIRTGPEVQTWTTDRNLPVEVERGYRRKIEVTYRSTEFSPNPERSLPASCR